MRTPGGKHGLYGPALKSADHYTKVPAAKLCRHAKRHPL